MEWIENNLDCSGICNPSPFYLFSNINSNEKPFNACLDAIKDKITDIIKIISIFSLGVALILLITLICNFVICGCRKTKKS